MNRQMNTSSNLQSRTSSYLCRNRYKVLCILACAGWIIYYICHAPQSDLSLYHPITTQIQVIRMDKPLLDVFVVKPFLNQTPWERLPNLMQMQWPPNVTATLPAGVHIHPHNNLSQKPPSFDPVMSPGQRNLYYKMMNMFKQLMDTHGFTNRYFLASGTLFGSYRHHDFIPWDDDVDLIVDVSLRSWLRSKLAAMSPEYRFAQAARDKLFTSPLALDQDNETDVEQSRQSTSQSWAWPFLDISYYALNRTHVLELSPSYGKYDSWPHHVIFPLVYRPFGSNWYPAPINPLEFLILSYDRSDICATPKYSHVIEKSVQSLKVKCRDLGARYHFVQRRPCLVNGSIVHFGQTMLVEERLVRRLPDNHEEVVHAFCLAADKQTARANTYALNSAIRTND